MSYQNDQTCISGNVAQATLTERQLFIRRTYAHVLAAVIAFVGASYMLYTAGVGRSILEWISGSQFGWLAILGAFMIVGWIATTMAAQAKPEVAYLGLALEVAIQALIFSPMLYLAHDFYPGVLPQATILTGVIFGGLTMYVFITKKDFSFLGPAIMVIGLGAVGVIVMGVFFGWNLGAWFSLIMIVFASAVILYTTSKVLHKYTSTQYVAASLEIFAAVALLFWYVLRLFMGRR
jgi:FtsH-binding integral membrane protein